MFASFLLLELLLLNLVSQGFNHVGQPCNSLIRICLASNSYCDNENICRCKSDYPVNISLHSCKKGKLYSQKCEYTEECIYYDPNSYCTQLPYRSTCECHNGFSYSEIKKICDKVGKENPKSSHQVFPAAIGIALASASIACFALVVWHVCKRLNWHDGHFPRPFSSSRTPYEGSARESQRMTPSAPPPTDETLPTYDTVTLKESDQDDCDPPPSYDEVISLEQISKT